MSSQTQLPFNDAKSSLFEIVFDGGSLGNPGKGYGSYEITSSGSVVRLHRHDYGDNVTNNQAEYQTLIEAVSWLHSELGNRVGSASVVIYGDSALVINQATGKWKVKNEGLKPLHQTLTSLLREFGNVRLQWHARKNSVARLGH